jgi:CBS domain-containing protein
MTLHVADRLRELPRREPVLADPKATLRSVAHTLWSESVGMAVVGDAQRPRGVISERDVVAALARGADPDVMTAVDAMTNYIISARPEDPLFDVAGQMIDDDIIRHLPILDENSAVVGMVSVRDLLRPMLLDALSGGQRGASSERSGQ